jgi:hypothetical protein
MGRNSTQQKKRGSRLGSRAPKGRVPLIRPRRDRIMGSSILASLSEAGGNDPFLPMSGPLPPHSPVGRIVLERDPLLTLCKCVAHRGVLIRSQHTCVFNHLVAQLRNRLAHSIPTWEAASQTGTLHIFSSPAPNSTFSPHFSRTIAIQTCPPSRAAA